jgi:two-component system, sporulation sensor kinase D
VLNENNTSPVIVLDSKGNAQTFRNVALHADNSTDSIRQLKELGGELMAGGRYIRIALDDSRHPDYIFVCYDDSLMLKRLSLFPLVQLCVLFVFILILVYALLTAKRSEQNRVWAGLSKETAHQLGTPISSLLGWMEILKEEYPDYSAIEEINKDVERLQLVADRFSKIGSVPELHEDNLTEVVKNVVEYMDSRTSKKVHIVAEMPSHVVWMSFNANLFGWVLENLCKNACDAIGDKGGMITVRVIEMTDRVAVEVQDTGKGIRKKDMANVFRPGFTTKKRGWGLGLSLAKRIVEDYHSGRIWVKSSEVCKGTTFRIELKN